MLSRILANVPLILLVLGVIILAPFFFTVGLDISFAKLSLLAVTAFLALIVYVIYSLRDGSIAIPKTRLWIGVGVLLLVTIISGLFSPVPTVSFLGAGGEVGTVFALLVFVALFTVAALTFRSREHALYLYLGLGGVGFVIALHYLLNLMLLHMGSTALSLGVFTHTTVNVIGKWNEFGIFYGLITILSLLALLLGHKTRMLRVASSIFLATGLVMVAIVNFVFAWWIIGIFSLLLFVYMISFGRALSMRTDASNQYQVPFVPLVVLLVSVIFLLPGNLGGALSDRLAISDTEVRPSIEGTARIATLSWQDGWKNATIGVGPNRFASAWTTHKFVGVNQTDAWNTDFKAGFGTIPSTAVTLGIVGILAWIVFLALFVLEGLRGIVRASLREASRLGVVMSFLAALYLWIVALMYTPSALLFAFAFLFSGVCVGLLAREEIIPIKRFSFTEDPRIGFVSVLVSVVVLIGSVAAAYGVSIRYVSGVLFRDGIVFSQKGDTDNAIARITSALRLYEHDSYYRALTQGYMARLGTISVDEVGQETALAQFREVLGNAITSAEAAIAYDKTNDANELALALVYAEAAAYGVEGAEDSAIAAYDRVAVLNPLSPEIPYLKARLAIANGDTETARAHIAEAIGMKNNYTSAIFLLAQIEESEGNMEEAIYFAEAASSLAPLDAGLHFQLGLLKYKKEDYAGAKTAFIRAVTVFPTYSNALYFLGLSYDLLGESNQAVTVFEELARRFPDNEEVTAVLSRLKSGQSAVPEEIEEAPEDGEEPPIEE
ncbi:MAG: tetratricopeptide repeat protein [Parcubacteria group bacterium]|nr:tetratricopeptide repeat protein [Parcubacteria group bacterium]